MKHLPSAQVMIPEFWDRAPCWAPRFSRVCFSLFLTLPRSCFFSSCQINKIGKKKTNNRSLYIDFISCIFTEFVYSHSFFFVESLGISCHLQTVTVFLYGFHIFLFFKKSCWSPYSTSLDFDVVFHDSLFAYNT